MTIKRDHTNYALGAVAAGSQIPPEKLGKTKAIALCLECSTAVNEKLRDGKMIFTLVRSPARERPTYEIPLLLHCVKHWWGPKERRPH